MTTLRTLPLPSFPSERVLQVCAAFGLRPVLAPYTQPAEINRRADEIVRVMSGFFAPRIALLSGPSGSGKSSTLHALAHELGRCAVSTRAVWDQARSSDRAVIDLLDLPLDQAMATLCRAGLGEPVLWAFPPGSLSEGEQARLAIALGIARLERTGARWLLIDECCSTLDALTARSVCALLRRWVDLRPDLRVVCASARDDLPALLRPDRQWGCAS